MSEDNQQANTAPPEEPKRTRADAYADFIGKQASQRSLFDTRDTRPVSKDDIASSTGKK